MPQDKKAPTIRQPLAYVLRIRHVATTAYGMMRADIFVCRMCGASVRYVTVRALIPSLAACFYEVIFVAATRRLSITQHMYLSLTLLRQ